MNKILSSILIYAIYLIILIASAMSLFCVSSLYNFIIDTAPFHIIVMMWVSEFILLFVAGMFSGKEFFNLSHKLLPASNRKYNRKTDLIVTSIIVLVLLVVLIIFFKFSFLIIGTASYIIGFMTGIDYYKIENKKDCLLKVFNE